MDFAGWREVSMVDYPGKIALTLFTSGCNFDCPYCHNAELKKRVEHTLKEETVFDFIDYRRKVYDAIVVTGGEPSLYGYELIDFFIRIRKYFPEKLLKVDTNGSNPDFIDRMYGVVDFVALDIKALDYSSFSNTSFYTIVESLESIKHFLDYEIRLTMYPPLIKQEDLPKYVKLLKGVKRVAVQQYKPVDSINPYDMNVLENFVKALKPYVNQAYIKF
ncbi:ribonucleoside-triphosphate reductase [Kosmotoga arenicorallina S304]|uniref:Ribonucleoside-triphosphate reductase n=1 Tax=Kosmotoga arenicorallina S304 TaxID=1453497 RepID=A0A176JZ06_9BACT|nr:anaerobic ribonucleoside-triphosphate reductase activating protein [Kosmotoga arenicorallina]OAA29187.1 ribonucleoside-triphosphate reductase [Kosmotoga arenicorallina S304]